VVIDCEDDQTLRAMLVGTLREANRSTRGSWAEAWLWSTGRENESPGSRDIAPGAFAGSWRVGGGILNPHGP
jgi:hypothetical protein